MKRTIHLTILATATVSALAGATVLDKGKTVPLSGTNVAKTKALVGPVILDKSTKFMIDMPGGKVPAIFRDRVVREKATGTLDFYCWVEVSSNLPAFNLTIARNGFTGASTDVEYRLDGVGTAAPFQARRSSNGADIFFDFKNATLGAGIRNGTRSLFVRTTATDFQTGGLASIEAGAQPVTVPVSMPK